MKGSDTEPYDLEGLPVWFIAALAPYFLIGPVLDPVEMTRRAQFGVFLGAILWAIGAAVVIWYV